MTDVLIRGKFRHRDPRARGHVKVDVVIKLMCLSTSQGRPRTAGHGQKLEEAGRTPGAFGGNAVLLTPRFWTSGLQM